MTCFGHDKATTVATLYNDSGMRIRIQEAVVCKKCGKVFSQYILVWDYVTGLWVWEGSEANKCLRPDVPDTW